MAFSATDAVFEGFRVVRRRPMTLVWWSLFYMVVMALAMAVIGGSLIRLVNAAEALEAAGGTPSPEDFMPILQLYMGVFAVVLPVSLAAGAVIYAAVSRAVLRPEESHFGYLRLGMDEVRVLVVTVVLGLGFIALSGVMFMLVGIVGGLAASLEAPWLWLVAVLLGLAAVAALIWLAVRLCLAVPITVGERRIAILDSFRLTRGRFWPLLGMAILAGVLSLVVGLLGSLVLTPLQFMTGGMTRLQDLEGAALAEILQTAWPMIAVWIVSNAILSALQVAVVYAPFSAAYRAIKGSGGEAASA